MTGQEKSHQSRKGGGAGMVLASLFGGVWLLIGAAVSLNGGKWPAFMPPQLDLIAVPVSMISEKWGAYVGGAAAAIVGIVCIGVGIFVGTKGDDA